MMSDSGIDTQARPEPGIGIFSFSEWTTGTSKIHDLYFLDWSTPPNDDFIGDCRIDCIYPNGAGYYQDFTPLADTNPEMVDEKKLIDNDTTYNESRTVGDIDTYELEPVPAPTGTQIFAIQQCSSIKKTDAGIREFQQLLRVNGTDYKDVTKQLSDTYSVYMKPRDVNPDDDNAWEDADINALQSGIEIIT